MKGLDQEVYKFKFILEKCADDDDDDDDDECPLRASH